MSFLLPLNQSNESVNATNWIVKGKGSEINNIVIDDKAFSQLLVMDVIPTKFLILFHLKQAIELTFIYGVTHSCFNLSSKD